jgi:acetyl CoA:N6-hydroxylysine acetyl transferase
MTALAPHAVRAGQRDWWDLNTPAGRFTLVPVKTERDLPLIHRWMNDPAVDEYWRLAGPAARTRAHLARQRDLPHTAGYLARLSGRPIGYWELYEAARDRLAAHYPARPTDVGIHLLIGEADCRGLGLGSMLLRALGDALQAAAPRRLVAEPDERNTASLRAFAAAGFTAAGPIVLPDKRAALILRETPSPRSGGDPDGAAR